MKIIRVCFRVCLLNLSLFPFPKKCLLIGGIKDHICMVWVILLMIFGDSERRILSRSSTLFMWNNVTPRKWRRRACWNFRRANHEKTESYIIRTCELLLNVKLCFIPRRCSFLGMSHFKCNKSGLTG